MYIGSLCEVVFNEGLTDGIKNAGRWVIGKAAKGADYVATGLTKAGANFDASMDAAEDWHHKHNKIDRNNTFKKLKSGSKYDKLYQDHYNKIYKNEYKWYDKNNEEAKQGMKDFKKAVKNFKAKLPWNKRK